MEENPFKKRKPLSESMLQNIITEVVEPLKKVFKGDVVPSLNIKIGDTVEVLWVVTDENEEETEVWWKARLEKKKEGVFHKFDNEEGDSFESQIYILAYNERKPAFPDESKAEVCFLSDKEVFDIELSEALPFRKFEDRSTLFDLLEPILCDDKDVLRRELEEMFEKILSKEEYYEKFQNLSHLSKADIIRSRQLIINKIVDDPDLLSDERKMKEMLKNLA